MSKQNESAPSTNWSHLVLELEQQYFDGKLPERQAYAELPANVRLASPLLLRVECVRLLAEGKAREAAEQLSLSVKAYAAQANEHEMLSMMGLLALLYTQIGGTPESRTILDFLQEEYERTPGQCSGFVLWALARRGGVPDHSSRQEHWTQAERYYLEAAARFMERGEHIWFAGLLLDRWVFDADSFRSKPEWERWMELLRQWAALYPICSQAYRLLTPEADDALRDTGLPIRFWILTQAIKEPARRVKEAKPFRHDAEVQLFTMPSELDDILAKEDMETAAAWLRRAVMLARSIGSPAALRLSDQLGRTLQDLRPAWNLLEQGQRVPSSDTKPASFAAEERHPERAIHVQLLSGLRLSTGDGQEIELKWKRRKARELLVYLLLQPNYRAMREVILEQVFGDGEASKLANHLYVSLHELRHVLKTCGWEGAVYARSGVIGIEEACIGVVDVEQYTTLCRVGDQLWADDREAALKLYLDAVQLYGQLGADMPYAEWLERWRSQLMDRQTLMLRRLIDYYTDAEDKTRTEHWLNQWILLRPDHEEAYQAMIRFWKASGHEAEAISWYRRLERVCEEELGTKPLRETHRLLWP
ncbi:AfsR/SARP family transcriptional regulator [Paenibacillus daejeonensis]|uniref:AfsR/SARP family transcriptional regulator n=1 Tax=Paenibacillus daejeonensis TaxID=135193 RepID=UPI000371463E|nr:BTAD domain-containing putative transcriptional regulator [Paenibacillus daejeonensis]